MLCYGRIIYAELPDPQGRNPKKRPAVVVTGNDDIRPDGDIYLVALSTQFAQAPPDVQVEKPWQAQGNCGTKLRTRCWAVCTWVTRMPASQITDLGGMVPPRVMIEISTKALGALGSGGIPPSGETG